MPQSPNDRRPSLNHNNSGSLAWFVSIGLSLLVAVLFVVNLQAIQDWWKLRDYDPPAAISRLADQDTMTPYARHLFYLNEPQLLSSVGSFRQNCPENEDTIVLGCYHPGQNGIYIYQVKDKELKGVTQVTAAHESLHAIYARLSDEDKRRVNALLADYYKHGLTDRRVRDEIKLYQKKEPGVVPDEMHSVFGTEVADLPPALEKYYGRYFTDRSAIVAFSQQYEQAFTARQAQISRYDNLLAPMKEQIESERDVLRAQRARISDTQSQLQALLSSGQTAEYNSRIPAYNGQIRAYNSGAADLKALIERYNQLVQLRNAIAQELTTLDKALDTRLAPAGQPAD